MTSLPNVVGDSEIGGRSILSNWIMHYNLVLVQLAIDDFFYRNGEEYIMDQDDHILSF